MASFIKNLFSTPSVDSTASSDVEDASRKVKKSRSLLLETEGGIAGEELESGGVSQRNSLLGN